MLRKSDVLNLIIAIAAMSITMWWREKPKNKPQDDRDSTQDDEPYRWDNDKWRIPSYEHWYAGHTDYQTNESNFWRHQVLASWASVGIGTLTLFAAISAGVIAYWAYEASSAAVLEAQKQAAAALKQVQISEDTERQDLRAYVYLETIAESFPRNTPPNRYAISLRLTNGGKTWARNLVLAYDVVRDGRTEPFDVLDLKKGTKPLVLGPNQSIAVQFGEVPFKDIRDIVEHRNIQNYVAWVVYYDTVNPTPVRWQTQLSQRLNADLENNISFSYRPTHNCADNDCPQ